MTRILATIGPNLKNEYQLRYFIQRCNIVRLNLSHGEFDWHIETIKKIKKIDPDKLILVDIPGIKPRTVNNQTIEIKKDQVVTFSYKTIHYKNSVPLSNPLPKINNEVCLFTISDGQYFFRLKKFGKNYITGISNQSFSLKPKKGLNIPGSLYNDKVQEQIYIKYFKMIKDLPVDCVGLSFIQNKEILIRLRKRFPKFFFVSKIENLLGFKNRKAIIENSDIVMIDRGDLAAETGLNNLTSYTNQIIEDCKDSSVPIIVATENLNSLINEAQPTKSEVFNLDYFIEKNVDYIMLSDETATSIRWKNTLNWLNEYLLVKKNYPAIQYNISIDKIISQLELVNLIIFTKEGYFYDKVSKFRNIKNFFIFTENIDLLNKLRINSKITAFYSKFPKTNIDQFLYRNIKKNKKIIFNSDESCLLVNIIFPRPESRANSLSIVYKKDF